MHRERRLTQSLMRAFQDSSGNSRLWRRDGFEESHHLTEKQVRTAWDRGFVLLWSTSLLG
jgi:hypothetical protein